MENSSLVNQTLNSSELQSVLGEGGQLALNLVSLLLLALPMVLSNGFVIIVLLIDKTTVKALRIALINILIDYGNILVCALITGVAFNTWLLAHIARRAGLASEQSLVLAIRISFATFLSSLYLRSIALSVLAVVVYTTIKKGPPKKVGLWCLSAVVIGFLPLAVIYGCLQASDMASELDVFLDGYHTLTIMSNFGKYLVLGAGIIIEILSKTVTVTFTALAFRHVKRNVSVATETGMRKAMLKFLITTMILNAAITIVNLSFAVRLFLDDSELIQQKSVQVIAVAIGYFGYTLAALATILIPTTLTVQFCPLSTTMKEMFGCRKVTSTVRPS